MNGTGLLYASASSVSDQVYEFYTCDTVVLEPGSPPAPPPRPSPPPSPAGFTLSTQCTTVNENGFVISNTTIQTLALSGIYYRPHDCNSNVAHINSTCSWSGTCKFGCLVCADFSFIGLYDVTCSPLIDGLVSGDHVDMNGTASVYGRLETGQAEFNTCSSDLAEPGGPPVPPYGDGIPAPPPTTSVCLTVPEPLPRYPNVDPSTDSTGSQTLNGLITITGLYNFNSNKTSTDFNGNKNLAYNPTCATNSGCLMCQARAPEGGGAPHGSLVLHFVSAPSRLLTRHPSLGRHLHLLLWLGRVQGQHVLDRQRDYGQGHCRPLLQIRLQRPPQVHQHELPGVD